jgi:hypothetical protein
VKNVVDKKKSKEKNEVHMNILFVKINYHYQGQRDMGKLT